MNIFKSSKSVAKTKSALPVVECEPLKVTVKANATTINMDVPIMTHNLVQYKPVDSSLIEFNNRKVLTPTPVSPTLVMSHQLKDDLQFEFKDARYYPDYHFIKSAHQFRDRMKPVNIVEPLNKSDSQQHIDTPQPIETDKITQEKKQEYEDRIKYLEEQIKGFYEQLELQTKINGELKSLLVASIGDDAIHYKIERLVSDKKRFELELTTINDKLIQLNEKLDQKCIESDLWRTKYQASKKLNEELTLWKEFLFYLQAKAHSLLKTFLYDNEKNFKDLNKILLKTSSRQDLLDETNTLTLNQVVDNLNRLMVDVRNGDSGKDKTELLQELSKNEFMTKQLLTQFAWLPTSNLDNSLESIELMLNTIKTQNMQVMQRFNENDTSFICCKKCKGKIKHI